jgi:hypothetical protein
VKSAFWLTLVVVIGWVLCVWPAFALRGQTGVIWMTIAAICCLVPGWIVVFLSSLAIFPNDLTAMLTQTLVRMAMVGAAALTVKVVRPDLGLAEFFSWLIGFYLLALAAEVVLLQRSLAADSKPENNVAGDSSKT